MVTASRFMHGTALSRSEADGGRIDVIEDSADIADAPDYADFPCSAAQERFWLLDRLEPGNPSYNVAVRWRLEGRVRPQLLQQAWREIIQRHEVLRTQFLEIGGKPVQRAAARVSFKLVEFDIGHLALEARQAEADRIGLIEARAPFDLGSGPLIRVVLVRLSPHVCVILVTTHQIVSDGWSIGVMAREMGSIYEALSKHQPPPLAPLSIQYGDYSLWQLEWLRQKGTDTETAYWSRQLAGIRPFEVVTDRPRPAVPTTNGAIVSLLLPRQLTNRMQALSAERGVTLFAAATATLCATLARYTGEPEIVLGTQVSDRDQVELEPMIGQFVSSLILRNDVRGNPSFSELLERVSATISEALEQRHIPIERLLEIVKTGHRGSGSPPVSVNFIFQRTFIENRNCGEFTLIDLPSLPAGAIYDLNFFMVERPDGWRYSCQFNTDQFEEESVDRLLRYFQSSLESALEHPGRRISELRLADPDEVERLAARLVGTALACPYQTVADQFAAQAALTPSAVAILYADRRLTFAQVDAQSEHLARYLQTRGMGPGKRVAICLERSPELVQAILAVLKAGAAYVPLDPGDPPRYLQRLIDSAGATLALTTPALASVLQASGGVIADFAAGVAAGSAVSLPPVAAGAPAAVWFRVNRPDQPAGVEISHRGLVNLLSGVQQQIHIRPTDALICLGRVRPESAPVELLLPLVCGARLVIASAEETADSSRLQRVLKRARATIAYVSPDHWPDLVRAVPPNRSFSRILCDRRTIDRKFASELLTHGAEVWALHGYIETTGCVSIRRLQQPHELRLLAEPLANTRFRVLDGSLKTPPVGARGQLFIGGDGMTTEYSRERQPDWFITDPAAGSRGAKLFRSGDSARILADGSVEIIDDELSPFNLHGYRLATSDITRALQTQPGVREALVIPSVSAGARDLIGIVVLQRSADAQREIDDLRAHLASTWPRSVQPDHLVAVESLSRAPNGEVDLRQLRTALTPSPPIASAGAEPAGELERGLAAIWAELLGAERIDPGGNFFELGGHSLLAARMLARVEAQFGRRITLASLFRAPTLCGLTRLVRAESREFDFRQVVKLQADGSQLPLIAVNNTGIYYLLAKKLGPQQPVTSLQVFDPSARRMDLPDSLEEIAAEYVRLIRCVHPRGPYLLMGWCVAGALAFEIGRQLLQSQEQVAHLLLVDSWVPGYFRRLPPLRRWIGVHSLRWQLIRADWQRYREGEQTLKDFFNERVTVKRLRAVMSDTPDGQTSNSIGGAALPESYDRWLLQYLKASTDRYEPKPYGGPITLFRSTQEPTGWLFDPLAGWGQFAAAGFELVLVPGNHFTMFQEPGVTHIASHLSRLIGAASIVADDSVTSQAR